MKILIPLTGGYKSVVPIGLLRLSAVTAQLGRQGRWVGNVADRFISYVLPPVYKQNVLMAEGTIHFTPALRPCMGAMPAWV